MHKCEWMKTEVHYLGHIISQGKVAPDPQKIQAIKEWPTPTTVKEVQAFLRLANYYRRFVFNFSHIANSLTNLTKKDQTWQWTSEAQSAFEILKQALISALILRIFDPNLPTRTEHDASDFAWAGILLQKHEDNRWHPVAYESRKLDPAQRNYDAPNKEFLAITESLKAWRHYLYGRSFEIITDHQSLTHIPTQANLTPRQVRAIESTLR